MGKITILEETTKNPITLMGKRANKRRKMYNGMIPCQLYMYYNAPKTEKVAKPMPKSGFDGKRTHFEKK